MKNTGFRKLTYAEVVEKQNLARQRKAAKPKPAPVKIKRPPTKEERVKTLKARLWKTFSLYIRKSFADPVSGMLLTCDGEWKFWQDTHCGHLINNSERSQSLGGNELWYYEHNFAPQSGSGNYFNKNDSAKKYMLWAVKRYGADEVDEMFKMKQRPRKYTEEELLAKVLYYQDAFSKL